VAHLVSLWRKYWAYIDAIEQLGASVVGKVGSCALMQSIVEQACCRLGKLAGKGIARRQLYMGQLSASKCKSLIDSGRKPSIDSNNEQMVTRRQAVSSSAV